MNHSTARKDLQRKLLLTNSYLFTNVLRPSHKSSLRWSLDQRIYRTQTKARIKEIVTRYD